MVLYYFVTGVQFSKFLYLFAFFLSLSCFQNNPTLRDVSLLSYYLCFGGNPPTILLGSAFI
jgi:hypothetical protein